MWWDQLKKVEHNNESRITWNQFKKYFHMEDLFEHFYDKKMQELFSLRMGIMTRTEYEKHFLGLLKYGGVIKDEKVKIQRILSGLPSFYKENIQYDDHNTFTETIRKAKYLYDKGKGREALHKSWRIRRKRILIRERKDSNLLST
jgi:hypothetical protein